MTAQREFGIKAQERGAPIPQHAGSFCILKSRLGTLLQLLLVYTSVCLIHKTKQPCVFYHITLYWAHWGAAAYSSFLWVRHLPPQIHVFGLWEEAGVPTAAMHTRGEQANATEKPPPPPRGFKPLHHRDAPAGLQKRKQRGGKKDLNLIYLLCTITKLSHE